MEEVRTWGTFQRRNVRQVLEDGPGGAGGERRGGAAAATRARRRAAALPAGALRDLHALWGLVSGTAGPIQAWAIAAGPVPDFVDACLRGIAGAWVPPTCFLLPSQSMRMCGNGCLCACVRVCGCEHLSTRHRALCVLRALFLHC